MVALVAKQIRLPLCNSLVIVTGTGVGLLRVEYNQSLFNYIDVQCADLLEVLEHQNLRELIATFESACLEQLY